MKVANKVYKNESGFVASYNVLAEKSAEIKWQPTEYSSDQYLEALEAYRKLEETKKTL